MPHGVTFKSPAWFTLHNLKGGELVCMNVVVGQAPYNDITSRRGTHLKDFSRNVIIAHLNQTEADNSVQP